MREKSTLVKASDRWKTDLSPTDKTIRDLSHAFQILHGWELLICCTADLSECYEPRWLYSRTIQYGTRRTCIVQRRIHSTITCIMSRVMLHTTYTEQPILSQIGGVRLIKHHCWFDTFCLCVKILFTFVITKWLIDYLRFYVPLKIISLIWRRHHCRGRAAKFRPMLGAQGLWAGRDLYRATPAVTRDLGFCGLIRRTAPFSCLLQHTRGCGGSILTRIFTGVITKCELFVFL
jgi:hypothetical protein